MSHLCNNFIVDATDGPVLQPPICFWHSAIECLALDRRFGFDALDGSGYLTRPARWGRRGISFRGLPALTSARAGDQGKQVESLCPDQLQLLCARSSAG